MSMVSIVVTYPMSNVGMFSLPYKSRELPEKRETGHHLVLFRWDVDSAFAVLDGFYQRTN